VWAQRLTRDALYYPFSFCLLPLLLFRPSSPCGRCPRDQIFLFCFFFPNYSLLPPLPPPPHSLSRSIGAARPFFPLPEEESFSSLLLPASPPFLPRLSPPPPCPPSTTKVTSPPLEIEIFFGGSPLRRDSFFSYKVSSLLPLPFPLLLPPCRAPLPKQDFPERKSPPPSFRPLPLPSPCLTLRASPFFSGREAFLEKTSPPSSSRRGLFDSPPIVFFFFFFSTRREIRSPYYRSDVL